MDAALVSRDPIPMHEELRGQRRAVVIGLVLAMLGIAGAAILGRLELAQDDRAREEPDRQVGSLHVVDGGPVRLTAG